MELGVFPAIAAPESQSFTYADLVHRLTDLEQLAVLPAPRDQCALWSSYDRSSRYDAAADKYINWDANRDGEGFIRKENGKEVLAEMQGPGCIWRIWSAAPKEAHVRIYLDGATEPVVNLPFTGYFDRRNVPFTRPALVYTASRGWNNYTPIPYEKSCKIVADPGWGLYFHFNYETFPPGTRVPTFRRELASEDSAALDEANRLLASCGPAQSGSEVSGHEGKLWGAVGDCTTMLTGPAAITSIRVKAQLPAPPEQFDALRSITLQIRWDGEAEPSVWAPLGDFFGTAPGVNNYRSLPLGMTDDGWFYCNWFMPFATNAEVVIRKEGKVPVSLEYHIGTKRLAGDVSQLGRFHAKWHRDAFLPGRPDHHIDWPVVKTEGSGRFVGMMLHIWNPRGGWWGEGDEKFFVDGEKFPSTIGTGSEDYFGYAWGDRALFQHAFHNQTQNEGDSKGHISVNRWHISDNVPFQKSFEGCIEKYFSNQRPTLYAALAYWYLARDGKDPYHPVPLADRIGYWVPPSVSRVNGAIEGEDMKILSKTGGNAREQDMGGFNGQWSSDAQLWWTDAKPGDKLTLALPVQKSAKYRITLQTTKARDYGITTVYLDDQKLAEPIDLYHADVVPHVWDMGSRKLTAGQHSLTFEITGSNERAIKAFMFGLDYVKLDPL